MSKLYAIRQTGKSNYWYDFVEDFTSSELDRNCISNNFAYVKECQNSLGDLNPAWKNSEIVEFREFAEKDDFEDLYYKSLEQRADLEAKLAESEKKFVTANNLRKNSDEVLLNYKTEKYGLDKTIQELRKIKLSLPEKEWYYKGFENCERQMSSHIADLTLEVKQLKQQLAEKDKQILELQEESIRDNQIYNEELAEKEKEIEELKHFKVTIGNMENNQVDISSTTYTDQDKISFCIEQLEKVKDRIESKVESIYKRLDDLNVKIVCESTSRQLSTYEEIVKELDNQIEELKKEMK